MPQNTTSSAPYKTDKTFWDDLMFQITTLATGGTPPDPIVFGPSGAVRCYAFDGASTLEAVEGAIQLPHRWKVGTAIYPHVHYAPTTANTGTILWQLDYYWLGFNAAASGAPTTIQASTTPAQGSPMGTAWKHMINAFPAITPGVQNISSIIMFRLFRDPTADTYPDDVALMGFDVHFEIDSFGSFGEYSK
jgi:hypothetical protein